jgi:hypothetical protein
MSIESALFSHIRQLEALELHATPYSYSAHQHREAFNFFRSKFLKAYEDLQTAIRLPPQVYSYREEKEKAVRTLELIVLILCELTNVTYLQSTQGEIFRPVIEIENADPGSYTTI